MSTMNGVHEGGRHVSGVLDMLCALEWYAVTEVCLSCVGGLDAFRSVVLLSPAT